MNKAILIGRLASDPETTTTSSGITKCSFRLAIPRRFINAQGDRETDFLPVIAWRTTADLCARYLAKGRQCAVEGTIQTRSYDAQDGTKRYVTEIIAEQVQFLGSRENSESSVSQHDSVIKQAQNTFGKDFVEVDDDELPF